MIISALIAISVSTASPKLDIETPARTDRIQLAGLFGQGKAKKFKEIVQQVQVERDHAPQVGRLPERAPEPFVPVRYLTPEQRAEPIIVEPEPIYVSAAQVSETASPNTAPPQDVEADQNYSAPSYITSAPVAAEEFDLPSGSATGSTAVADYGTPG
jgi:hypothetical protein